MTVIYTSTAHHKLNSRRYITKVDFLFVLIHYVRYAYNNQMPDQIPDQTPEENARGMKLYQEYYELGKKLMAKLPTNFTRLGSIPKFFVEYLVELPDHPGELTIIQHHTTIYHNGFVYDLQCEYFYMELIDYKDIDQPESFKVRINLKNHSSEMNNVVQTPSEYTPDFTKYVAEILTVLYDSCHEFEMVENTDLI